ncbi:hypothetical protein [Croceicoccus gelatinilyticus]|uniref:hypothetical protein n=1 Tax=Croceicoccus gelatinilyticus TaxID=2835536 RepID=UPI001BCF85FF|nr:hypothetical protein [Croceicoccus gelatinilyticus]MBS7670989.1 hypothetical protein [Croceicoccus gelatinilyticus]
MTEAEVIEAKRLRNTARGVFDTQKDLVRADLDAASLGKRVATRISEDGRYLAEEAADAANRNKALTGLGALAVTALLFRKPLMAFAGSIFGSEQAEDESETAPEAEKEGAE